MRYVGEVIGYASAPGAFIGDTVTSGVTVAEAIAAVAPASVGAMAVPAEFFTEAMLKPAWVASAKSS